MATKEWDKFIADFKKLSAAIDRNDSKTMKRLVDNFLIWGKNAETLEDNLVKTLPKARENGVTGDSLSDFKKDKGFSEVYKTLQKTIDMMYAAQQEMKVTTNNARQTSDQLKALEGYIEKDLKSRKAKPSPADMKELDKLRKQIATARKDLDVSGDMMGKAVDRKLATYVEKSGDNIKKLLDLAPQVKGADDKVALRPAPLNEQKMVLAWKQARLTAKKIDKHCEAALKWAFEDKKRAAPEMKAGGIALGMLKKVHLEYAGALKKYLNFVKQSDEGPAIQKMIREIETAFKDSEKRWKAASIELASRKA